jgi:hypothetical protein
MDARAGVGIGEPRGEKRARFSAWIRAVGRLCGRPGGAKLAKFGAKKKLFIFNDLLFAGASYSKLEFGAIERNQSVAVEKIWKNVVASFARALAPQPASV